MALPHTSSSLSLIHRLGTLARQSLSGKMASVKSRSGTRKGVNRTFLSVNLLIPCVLAILRRMAISVHELVRETAVATQQGSVS